MVCFSPVAGINCVDRSLRACRVGLHPIVSVPLPGLIALIDKQLDQVKKEIEVSVPLPGLIALIASRLESHHRGQSSFSPVAGINCVDRRVSSSS